MAKKRKHSRNGSKPQTKVEKGSKDETGSRTATLKLELPGMKINVPALHKEAEHAARQFADIGLAEDRYKKAREPVMRLMKKHKVNELAAKIPGGASDVAVIFKLTQPSKEPKFSAKIYNPHD